MKPHARARMHSRTYAFTHAFTHTHTHARVTRAPLRHAAHAGRRESQAILAKACEGEPPQHGTYWLELPSGRKAR